MALKDKLVSGESLSKVATALSEKQDKLTSGSNINIVNNVISATDTTYTNLPAEQDGVNVSVVTTGEKYTWNNKQDAITSSSQLSSDYVTDTGNNHKFVTEGMYEYLENAVYQHPEVNSLTIYDNSNNPITSSYESGASLTVSKVSHKETNISNISGNLTLKYRPNVLSEIVISDNISPSSTDTDVTVNRSLALVSDISFILSGTDTKGTAFEKISVINVYTYAYTAVTNSIIIPTTGLTRQSKLPDFRTDGVSISYSAGDYIYFYTQTSGNKIYQYTAGQWIEVAGSSLGSVTITKSNGATAMYYAYKFGPMSVAGTDTFRVS